MARCPGIDRLNRYPKDNKIVLAQIFGVEPKKGKMLEIVNTINSISLSIIATEVSVKYTVSDFFFKSKEVFSFITKNRLEFLYGHVTNRGYDLQIGPEGFGAYESINPNFLKTHKDTILNRLDELGLITFL